MKGAIVYVSSNKEDPMFEHRIFTDMLKKIPDDLPIYAVTQKRMYNVDIENVYTKVVGDVGVSGFNFCRQLQMAIEMAEADYVISCEADCLYSPDYFSFVPPKLDGVYRNTNNYVIPYQKNCYRYKKSQTAFQVAGRKFLLDRLNYLLNGQPQWNVEMKSFPKEIDRPFLLGWYTFKTQYPCITIKTGNGMRKVTNSNKTDIVTLPYWGTAKKIRKDYL